MLNIFPILSCLSAFECDAINTHRGKLKVHLLQACSAIPFHFPGKWHTFLVEPVFGVHLRGAVFLLALQGILLFEIDKNLRSDNTGFKVHTCDLPVFGGNFIPG